VALLIDDLADQLLEQTRVVTNGPVLEPHEALHVDVVPGGAGGDLPVNDVLSLALGATNALDVLHVSVSYEVQKDGVTVAAADMATVPTPDPVQSPKGLLSAAFLLKPKVKLIKANKLVPDLDLELPKLDYKLIVTLEVSDAGGRLQKTHKRVVEVPFTTATIKVPLPIPPAVCICAQDAGFKGSKFLVMVPPGAPESVAEIVSTYNTVLDAINALDVVLKLAALVVKPLKLVTETLAKIPTPYVTTSARVQDFDDYDDFDDELSSFILVGPTGYGVTFNDTADPGDWDDWFTNEIKSYRTIDILQLPNSPHGQYVMGQLGLDPTQLGTLAQTVADLTGVPLAGVELGIGVFLVHDLTSGSVPHDLRTYDNDTNEDINDDIESAMWITA
jgi:hypothetical protein